MFDACLKCRTSLRDASPFSSSVSPQGPADAAELERVLKKWNWGAFFLTAIWGVGNRTYLGLLGMVPVVNFIIMPVLGVYGNRWAWKNKKWRSLEEFEKHQRMWAKWGTILAVLTLLLWAVPFSARYRAAEKTDVFRLSLELARENPGVVEALGLPIQPSKTIKSTLQQKEGGTADLQYQITGPKGEGTVQATGRQERNRWQLLTTEVIGLESGRTIKIPVPLRADKLGESLGEAEEMPSPTKPRLET